MAVKEVKNAVYRFYDYLMKIYLPNVLVQCYNNEYMS